MLLLNLATHGEIHPLGIFLVLTLALAMATFPASVIFAASDSRLLSTLCSLAMTFSPAVLALGVVCTLHHSNSLASELLAVAYLFPSLSDHALSDL